MINVEKAQMYCAQPIELIENYEKAVNDTTQIWHCHHIWETMLGYSREELKKMNEYYGIPACNLIFLTPKEHMRIHHKGKLHTEEWKKKVSESMKGENSPLYGVPKTEEHKNKLKKARSNGRFSGENAPWYGKKRSEETKRKISETKKGKYNGFGSIPVLQYTLDGVFVSEYPSIHEAERKTKIIHGNINSVCNGKRKSAGGFIWKYKK